MERYEIENKINNIYTTRQFEARQDYENRLNSALSIPEFKALYMKRRELSLLRLNKASKDIEEDYKNTSKALLDLINKNNIDLNIYYKCKKCNDTGRVNGKDCSCKIKLLSKMLRETSNLPASATFTFKDNRISSLNVPQKKLLSKIYKNVFDWTQRFEESKMCNIILAGQVGVGKTSLAYCAANEVLNRGFSVYYTSAFDLAKILLDNYFSKTSNSTMYNIFKTVDLLIIDDLGTEPNNSISSDCLLSLLSSRISDKKKTILCSSFTPSQLDSKYDKRLTSRLLCKDYSYFPDYIMGTSLRNIQC